MSFSSKLIEYYYDNIYCPYHVQKFGAHVGETELCKVTSKVTSNNNKKRKKIKNKSFDFAVNKGTVHLATEEETNTPGDFNVDNVHLFYLGKHKIRNGDRKQTYTRAPDPSMQSDHKYSDAFKSQDFDLDRGIVMNVVLPF